MAERQVYTVQIQRFPQRDVEYTGAAFIEQGERLHGEVSDVLRHQPAEVIATPRSEEYPWIDTIDIVTPSKEVAFDIVARILPQRKDDPVAKRFCSMKGSLSPASVATARWIRVEGDYYDAEEGRKEEPVGNTYPVACSRCGWPDYSKTPDPFMIHPDVLKGGKRELFDVRSGLLIVKPRAMEVLREFAPDEFDVGIAKVAGQREDNASFHWVRPRQHIGGYAVQGHYGECCPECKRPSEFRRCVSEKDKTHPGGPIIDRFGDFKGNLALIGQEPQSATLATAQTKPPTHWIAISGGLFAALYNRGIKGLALPDEGPLNARLWEGPLISNDINEPTWESERRFADAFPGKADKFVKKNVKS